MVLLNIWDIEPENLATIDRLNSVNKPDKFFIKYLIPVGGIKREPDPYFET